jgi:hypothetical protein
MPAPTTGNILNEAIAGYGQVGDAIRSRVPTEQAIGQERLLGTTQAALGGIDEQAFLAQHPEFNEGYQNAIATGDNPSRWLELAINEASYINPSEVPRAGGITGTLGATAGQLSGVETATNTAARTAGVGDVAALSGQLTGAYRAANPELFASLGSAGALQNSGDPYSAFRGAVLGQQTVGPAGAQGYSAAMARPVEAAEAQMIGQGQLGQSLYEQALGAGPSGAANILQGRAQQFAASTGQLSPEELRAVQQGSREAYAARGIEMSNPAIAGEIGARIAAQRSRQTEDLQMAAGLNQAYTQDLTANRGFASGIYGQDLGRESQNQSAGLQAALAKQQAGLALSLADQQAINSASAFTANASNEQARFNAQLAAQQQQQGISNLGMLGQMNQGQTEADRAYALNLAGGYRNAAYDPAGMILGQQSGALGAAGGVYNAATGANPDLSANLGLTTGVAQDTAMFRANAEEAARIAAANRSGAFTGQILGAAGTVAGAALGVPSIGAAAGAGLAKVFGKG